MATLASRAAHVVDELEHVLGDLGAARAERRQEVEQQRLELAMEAERLQYREREREQRHDREHRRVDEAHRAQAELALEEVAEQREGIARELEPPRRGAVIVPTLRPEKTL